MAVLVLGCTQPPARQGVGVSRVPLRLPAQTATLPRPQVQLASVSAVSDYDRDDSRWQDVVTPPPPARVSTRRQLPPPPTRAVPSGGLQHGVGLTPGIAVSSVRYAPPQVRARPAGVLSITQVGLDSAATMPDSATEAVDALERRLGQGPRSRFVTVPIARGMVNPDDSVTAVIGIHRPTAMPAGFGGVDFLPPIRFSWTTGSPLALGELGTQR
jgi:hypothetical protein